MAGWSWAGRSPRARWWYGHEGYYAFVLGALPGFGLLLCVGGIYQMNRDAEPYLVPFFLIGFVVLVVGVIRPAWWGPPWFRRSPEGGGRWRRAAR